MLVGLSLIIATLPRLHSFFSKIPSGQLNVQLRSFLLPSRFNTLNRTEAREVANSHTSGESGESGGSGNSEGKKSIQSGLNDKIVTNIGGIQKDRSRSNAALNNATPSNGNHRAIKVEYYVKREQG